MNKKGIEISVKFLISIILALVVFIFAMTFAFRFFGSAEDYRDKVEQSTRQEIESMMINQGQKVAAYPTQIELYPSKSENIGLGIFSVNRNDAETFKLNVSCAKYLDPSDVALDLSDPEIKQNTCDKIKILYVPHEIELQPNANHIFNIYVENNNAWRGTYVINGEVVVGGQKYGSVQKIYLKAR